MSLFAGIKFTSEKAKALATESAEGKSAPAEVSKTVAPASAKAAAPAISEPAQLPPKAESKPKPPKPVKAPAEILQFAPRLKPKPKPATVYTSAPVPVDAPVLVVPPPAPKPDIERAPTIARGPKRVHPDGPKRKKKKKIRRQVVYTFQPDEDYDPARPNDLGEYQQYRAQLRAERKKAKDSSSDYSDSSDEAPRRDAPRSFAPPKLWAPPPSLAPQRVIEAEPAPTPQPVRIESGDDAYARRAAMTAASGDDAYARRLAMSQQVQQPSAPPPVQPPPPPSSFQPRPSPMPTPPFPPPQIQPPAGMPLPPPGVGRPLIPPPGIGQPRPPSSIGQLPLPPPGVGQPRPPPGLGQPPLPPPGIGRPALAPTITSVRPGETSSAAPPPTSAPIDPEYQRRIDDKKREVAAKLAAMTGTPVSAEPQPEQPEDQSGTFAERLMRKWGHKEGSGIGARGDGIVHALTTEHVVPQKTGMSKRAAAKARAAAANAKQKAWSQAPVARGRIVDASAEERATAERERVGDASRVVVLSNVVESEDAVDEGLADDIGAECSKYGIVQRVVLHIVESEDPSEVLRVFVVFSGMAGAWRAVRELDGGVFAGRKIRARYFDERKFEAGERDGKLFPA